MLHDVICLTWSSYRLPLNGNLTVKLNLLFKLTFFNRTSVVIKPFHTNSQRDGDKKQQKKKQQYNNKNKNRQTKTSNCN